MLTKKKNAGLNRGELRQAAEMNLRGHALIPVPAEIKIPQYLLYKISRSRERKRDKPPGKRRKRTTYHPKKGLLV